MMLSYFSTFCITVFLCYFPRVAVTLAYLDYFIKVHTCIFFFYWAVFNRNQIDCLIDSYNFCNSKKITASSSGPISVYRWF